MAVPSPQTWPAGSFVDDADLNREVRDAIDFLLAPPRCYAYKSGNGALATGTWDAINFDSEAYDSHNAHDPTTNNSRISAPEAGLYTIAAAVEFDANATGSRRVQIRKNANATQTSGTLLRSVTVNAVAGAGNPTTIQITFDAQLSAADYVELFAQQTSGGPLNVLGTIAGLYMSIRWCAKTA